jgi:hypothetical protein
MATPSLAMIPSAYADSKVYSVLPNNGDGDFTFNRDSSATRVGQNGLIQTVGFFGNEEITNGDFATDTDWTKGTGWTISGGSANASATTGQLYQATTTTINTQYKIEYTISNYVSGTYNFLLRGVSTSAFSGNGTFTVYLTSGSGGNANFIIDGVSAFTGSIDNISVKEVTGDQPRLNYDISNGVVQSCPSLLLEPASTNLIAYSQDFSNYSTVLGIIAESGFTDPSGTTTAYKLSNFANNGSRFDYTTPVTAVNGTTYTYSAYYKGSGTIRINCSTSGGVGGSGEKDIVLTNEWKREEISFTAVNPTGNVKTHTAITRTANNNAIVYLAFTQIEALSYATSYIPTNGASQTRAAETCFGAGNANTFNDSQGTIYAEIAALSNDLSFRLIALKGTSDDIRFGYRTTSNAIYVDAPNAFLVATVSDITLYNKIAIKYGATGTKFFINGSEVGADADSSSFSGIDTLDFDATGSSNYFFGKCKDLRVYNEALTDAQLQALTT